ncbi:MAG: 16S rRNA (cytosine(967)-C(5))-methyltransferase RsmB [Oscillospiraceae bacterium]|nr:16S rRNA (cytosine(967)-C(5))-methyltransferase RsmB [Oscillospiraceae bacterium]
MKNKNFNEKLNVREACLKSLINYEKDRKYSNIELSEAVDRYDFSDLDRAFFTRLFYGVIEKKITLDYYINCLCDKKTKIEPDILNILRMGLYQVLYMEKVPDNAACNESVELAKKSNPNNIKIGGFANAVLRNFIRQKDEFIKNIEKINVLDKRLEIKYSFSYDIIKIWKESYGIEITEKLLEVSEIKPNLTVTVNTLKILRDKYLDKLNAFGTRAEKTEFSEYGINILDDMPIRDICGFDEGLFFVQDEASQICAAETEVKEGGLVIDCCAAPGGKSMFMAQMMRNNGRIICFDLHKNKLNLINQSAKRLGIDIIETYEHDSTVPSEIMRDIKADAVLCDVPCSGLGVANKKPEIKYKSLEDIDKLPEIQYKILSCCSEYVKPGGVLVYSTCTLNKKENEEVAEKFLSEYKNFKCENIKTFFPFERKIDGFFLVKMRLISV